MDLPLMNHGFKNCFWALTDHGSIQLIESVKSWIEIGPDKLAIGTTNVPFYFIFNI